MRRSIIWSAAFHLLVLVLVIVGLPRLWDTHRVTDEPVILDVVNIDKETTAKEMPKPAAKEKTPKKPTPAPEPPKARPKMADIPPPPEPPKVAEKPAPDAEKVPIKPTPKPKKKEPEKKKPAEAKPTPPKAIARARPRHKPPPPKDDFLQSVLRDISPEERSETPDKNAKKEQEQPQPKKAEQRRAPLDAVATTSEIDAIRHAIEQCWNIPAGARDAENLVVSIRVFVNPDGTVREARILDQSRMLREPFFRTAAESALRAVLNPRCSPLPIPPKKYDQFKEMVLDFNPKTAAGS